MKIKLLTIFTASMLLIGMNSQAQVTDNGTTNPGNVSGSSDGTPPSLDIDFETLMKWMIRRVHTINFDAITNDMDKNGIKNARLGFSAEGALVYHYELAGEKIDQWDDIGRNAGAQILPYSIQIMPNGVRKISVSGFALKNMTALQGTEHLVGGKTAGLLAAIDRVDVLNLTWDKNSSFSNLNTFDFTAITGAFHVGLSKSKSNRPNYIAVRAGGNVGFGTTEMSDADQYGYSSSKVMGLKTEYSGGLEINLQARSKIRLNLQSNYVAGYGEVQMNNIDQGEAQTMIRKSAYIKNSIDFSVPLRVSHRPMRLGMGANVNLVMFDRLTNSSQNAGTAAQTIDLTGNYSQKFRGRLYLNF